VKHPPYSSLPAFPNQPHLRLVNNRAMDRATYDLEDWVVLGEYQNDRGETVLYWGQTLEGIARASAARRQRIAGAVARREQEDQWSEYIEREVVK
jgi:hypothetical protein